MDKYIECRYPFSRMEKEFINSASVFSFPYLFFFSGPQVPYTAIKHARNVRGEYFGLVSNFHAQAHPLINSFWWYEWIQNGSSGRNARIKYLSQPASGDLFP
jgi:hypothetical protein